jgi:hypothetical protein
MLFFFNLAGATYDPDVVGVELPSMAEARLHATVYAGELLRDRPGLAWEGEELRVEITDESQLVLFTLIIFGVEAARRLDGPDRRRGGKKKAPQPKTGRLRRFTWGCRCRPNTSPPAECRRLDRWQEQNTGRRSSGSMFALLFRKHCAKLSASLCRPLGLFQRSLHFGA